MKRALALVLLTVLLTGSVAVGATRVTIGTGPWGGVFFPVGSALATVLNRYVRDVSVTAEPVEGSAHALELLHTGQLTLAIVAVGAVHSGVRGAANVGFVMGAMDAGQTLVTLADSGIHTYPDVRGLRVAVNTPASKALLVAVLKLHGVGETDVQLTYMNFAAQISALREERIDAAFLPVTPYNADVAALASDLAIRVLGLDPINARALERTSPWIPVPVNAQTYEGQNAEVLVPGSRTALLAHKQVDPALIYRIVKAIVDHPRALRNLHPGGAEFTVARTRFFIERKLVPAAFHPGAERYWRERHVLP
jgi:TRAP transporter TAXI family solute receptor